MRRSYGFTLVELMIALVIGLLIILGASQLFLTSHASYQRIEALSARQETLSFIVDTLLLDLRTADKGVSVSGGGWLLEYETGSRSSDPYCNGGELNEVYYEIVEVSGSYTIRVDVGCDDAGRSGNPQPLASGLGLPENGLIDVSGLPLYVVINIRFPEITGVLPESDFSIRAARRQELIL